MNKGYLQRNCVDCERERKKEYDKANPDKRKDRYDAFMQRRLERAGAAFDEWVTDQPAMKVMTEEQWLETCSYFEGCCICGDEHIETREFFVPFQEGGRYAVWNILPMCGTCGKTTRTVKNPFEWFDVRRGTAGKLGLTQPRLEKILVYLKSKMEGL